MRESRAAREGLQPVVYRWAVKGPVTETMMAEVRRAHILRNKVTEAMRAGDERVAGLHAAQPDVAAAAEVAEAAAGRVKELRAGIQARKSAGRTRRPDPQLAAALEEARAVLAAERESARAVKAAARERLRDAEKAIRAEVTAALKALYGEATGGALYEDTPAAGAVYWATFNMVRQQQDQALQKVISRRLEGLPAELSFRRWDGSGTIAVQPQRGASDPARTPAELAAAGGLLRDMVADVARHFPEQVRYRPADTVPGPWAPRVGEIARQGPGAIGEAGMLLADLRAAVGDGRIGLRGAVAVCAAMQQVAASWPGGKWRNVILLQPGRPEEEWASLPPRERKRAELRIRVGSGESASLETLRIVMHRPLPDDADVVSAQVTVRRVTSTRLRASVAVTVLLPAPEPRAEGPAVAVHTGWRVLPDGAIRVAVITGAQASPPAGMGAAKDVASARRRQGARLKGERPPVAGRPWAGDAPRVQECGIRDHGDWQEVVIPPGIRDLAAHAASLGGIRDQAANGARKAVAAFLGRFPDAGEAVDPRGSLDRWRSPGRFRAALAVMEGLAADAPEVRGLRAWEVQDVHLELWEAYEGDRHVLGWRRDLYRRVGAWLAGGAGVIVADSWDAGRRRPDAGEEDTAQEQAARANAVLAAPGDLRHQVKVAAGRRGVTVRDAPAGLTGVHHGCGGELPAGERAAGVHVVCRACGRRVDQDLNAARAMAASGGVVP